MNDYKKFTILIVDDEEDLREVIIYDFERKGFNVISAGSGIDAFELVQNQKIHLVISDIRMPKGDGISFLERLRITHPETPVLIFITGFADITEEECLAKGAKKVLTKPYDQNELMDFVLKTLGLPA